MRGFFLLEEGLEYGLVAPFPAYGFATLVSHNENLNSLNSGAGLISCSACSRSSTWSCTRSAIPGRGMARDVAISQGTGGRHQKQLRHQKQRRCCSLDCASAAVWACRSSGRTVCWTWRGICSPPIFSRRLRSPQGGEDRPTGRRSLCASVGRGRHTHAASWKGRSSVPSSTGALA